MVVALGTIESGAKENRGSGVDPVKNLVHAVFLRMHAGLDVTGGGAVEAGGNALGRGGVGQQITGDLLDDKLVKGHISIEGVNHPVTVGPAIAKLVGLETIAIGVARQIQPRTCPALSITRRGQQLVDHIPVGLWAGIL